VPTQWTDRIWLSTDNVLGGDTNLGDTVHNGALAATASYNGSANVTPSAGLTPGSYFLFIQSDLFSQVAEENEGNNTLSQPITITP
jgi:subtilase family serine protease